MRNLTEEQQLFLKSHLTERRIEYIELYDEIYDHYVSAYESGNEEFEVLIKNLDQHFTQEYIDEQRETIVKRQYKNLLSIYKKELLSFFQWPQILTTVLLMIAVILLAHELENNIFMYYILIPNVVLLLIPFAYYGIQIHRKLIFPYNLKSAAYDALNKVGLIPVLIHNILIGINTISQEGQPWISAISVILIFCYTIISIKVFKQRIKYQIA